MDRLQMLAPASLGLLCGEMKKSRFKIWMRAALFVIFGSMFTLFFRDI